MAVENRSGELLTPTSLGRLCPLPIKAPVSGLEEKGAYETAMVLHSKVCWAAENP